MKILIGTQYIDLSVVTQIEVIEKEDINLHENFLRFHFFADSRILDIKPDLSKLKSLGNCENISEIIKKTVPQNNRATKEDVLNELYKFCGDLDCLYMVEDVRIIWDEFKDNILNKWNNTESMVKDIKIYK